jgi:hypothetical protein
MTIRNIYKISHLQQNGYIMLIKSNHKLLKNVEKDNSLIFNIGVEDHLYRSKILPNDF